MVKKGGLKRKIPIEKIEKKTSRGPCYSKRCQGLFGKASQLCLLTGAQIAVLATPMSDNSNVSFFSFGHSSVDAVVSAFLSGKRPLLSPENNKHKREDMSICLTQKKLGLGFWWEDDDALTRSRNPKELRDAVESMSKLLKEVKRSKDALNDQLTNPPAVCCNSDDFLQKKDSQIMANSEDFCITNNNNNENALPVEDLDQTLTDPCISDDFFENIDAEIMANSQGFCINDNNNENASAEEYLDQTLTNPDLCCISDDFFEMTDAEIMACSQDFCITDNNNALPAEALDDIDMDLDQIIDFGPTSETLLSPYDEVLKTSYESLLSNGVFESTQELREFAASLLTFSDSHDPMDPTMFSDSEPVKDGDLVLQNRGGLNDDHLHSFDVFDELTPIVTL